MSFRGFQKERKILINKRLDLDSCKSRLRKAKSIETQANVSRMILLGMWEGRGGVGMACAWMLTGAGSLKV